jgi:acyl dehydratase
LIDAARVLAHPGLEVPYRYDTRETMLHALATGIGMDAMDTGRLPFAYEDFSQPLQSLPTQPIVLGWVDLVRDPRARDAALGIDPHKVVVGQAVLTLHRPVPVQGEGTTRSFFADLVDKGPGRGAMLLVRREVLDARRDCIATVDTWLFVRGGGGFGGKPEGGPPAVAIPERAADAVVEQPTAGNVALLYRLMLRDHNAVHADPVYAAQAGFEQPILHGLATFSMAIHSAIAGTTGGVGGTGSTGGLGAHAHRLASAQARLVSPVFPGDRLRTEAWNEAEGVVFRTTVPARSVTVIDAGRLVLRG